MRLLNLSDHSAAEKLMEAVTSALKGDFSWQVNDVKILTGTEEAIYGWISTNLLAERFSQVFLSLHYFGVFREK